MPLSQFARLLKTAAVVFAAGAGPGSERPWPMATTSTCDHMLRLLERALNTGVVVELAGRALVRVTGPGPVVPHDRTGTWLGFMAPEPGLYA